MNWLDYTLLICIGISTINGIRVGASRRILQIASAFVAFSYCWVLAPLVREHLFPLLDISPKSFVWLTPIVAFALIYFVLMLLGGWFISMGRKLWAVRLFDNVAGGVLGLVIGIYALGYMLSLVEAVLPSGDKLAIQGMADARSTSILYIPIRDSITDLDGIKSYFYPSERSAYRS